MDNYVMDFLVLDDKVQAIEINCYGSILIPKYFDIFLLSQKWQDPDYSTGTKTLNECYTDRASLEL